MKALTLWQPWASLVAWGEKRYETRSWKTDYRGPLAIHAAQARIVFSLVNASLAGDLVMQHQAEWNDHGLSRGAILCVVDLVSVDPVDDTGPWLSDQERACGDYAPGRCAWKLDNLRVLVEPIPARGFQGLWTWDRTLESLEFKRAA